MVHGQPTDPVFRENVLDQEAGLQHNHALLQAALIQLKQLAAQILSTRPVVLQVVQLALKPMVRGQLLETVFKENVLGQGVGLQYKPILILVVTVLQQK
jgi:hypothetical protein